MDDFAGMTKGGEGAGEDNETPQHMGLHEHDLSEGIEFLNDSIRMNEQVFKVRAGQTRRNRYHL